MIHPLLFLNLGGSELIFLMFILFVPFCLWLWALVDLLKSDFTKQVNKLVWLVLIVFLPLLGVPLYFFIADRQKL